MQVCVRDIMTHNPISVTLDSSVGQAASIMGANKIGCLPVLENNQLIGIITSQDIRTHHANRLVADAMSPNVITVQTDTPIWEAAEIMKNYQIEHLLVTQNDQLIGLVTKGTLFPFLSLHCDHLTELPRASYGCYLLTKWLTEAKPVGSIFLDLDKFGEINKRFGHASGDRVLCETAQVITSQVTPPAAICRYGGDEFLVVIPDEYQAAYNLAHRILHSLENSSSATDYNIGASAGIASMKFDKALNMLQATKAAEELISQSSLAAMQAKTDGSKIHHVTLASAS